MSNRGAPPYVRNIKSPGLEFGASDQYRSPVPENLNVKTVGADLLGVTNLNVTGTFTYSNVNASLTTQTSVLEEYTVGQGIQLADNMRINANNVFFQIPVWDTSGVTLGGYMNLGGYDTGIANTMPMTNTSDGGISFYNTNGLMAYITKNAVNLGTVSADRITSITPSLGIEAVNLIIGSNAGTRPGSVRFQGNVLQYCDNFGTYITLSAAGGSSLVAGNGISIVGNTVSLQAAIANLTSVSSTNLVVGSSISYSGASGFLLLPSGGTLQLRTSASVNGPGISLDGSGNMTIGTAGPTTTIGTSIFNSTSLTANGLIVGTGTNVPGSLRYSGDRIQFFNASLTWQNVGPDVVAGTNINVTTDGFGNKTVNTIGTPVFSTATSSNALTLTNTNNTDSQVFAKLTNSGTLDANFELIAARGAVTNASDSIVAQLAMRYAGGNTNAALRFHRGTTTSNGYLSMSTSNVERMRIDGSGASTFFGTLTSTGSLTTPNILATSNISPYIAVTNLSGATNIAMAYYSGFSSGDTSKILVGRSPDPGGVTVIKHNFVSGLDPTNSAIFGLLGNENLIQAYFGGWVTIQSPVILGTGSAQTGGLRMNSNVLQFYNGLSWRSVVYNNLDGGVNISKTSAGDFNALTMLSSLSAGQTNQIIIGSTSSNFDAATFRYYHNADGGSNNRAEIGLPGNEARISISPTNTYVNNLTPIKSISAGSQTGEIWPEATNPISLRFTQTDINSAIVANMIPTVCSIRAQVQYSSGSGLFVTTVFNNGFDLVDTDGFQYVEFTLTKKNLATCAIMLTVSYANVNTSAANPRQTMIGAITAATKYQVFPYDGTANLLDMLDVVTPNPGFYFDLIVI